MAKVGAGIEDKKPDIILHQFPRGKNAPSPSPYPIKVETFLRMNKLAYTSGNDNLSHFFKG